MKNVVIVFLFFVIHQLAGQVGINTTSPIPQSSLHIEGSNTGTLINRVALTGRNDILTIPGVGAASEGLMIYNTATGGSGSTSVTPGFYYWNGASWDPVANSGNRKLGWVSLSDGNYVNTLPFVNSPDLTDFSNFENIDLDFSEGADSVIESFAPTGYLAEDFYDSLIARITPLGLGDAVILRLQFDATPLQNNGVLVVQIDIGANDIPGDADDIIIFQKSIPLVRGGTRITNVSETIPLFQLGTFLANGGKLRMAYTRSNNTGGSSCGISNFSLVMHRISAQ